MARKKIEYKPSIARIVEELASRGIPRIEIAKCAGCSPKVMARIYERELEMGRSKANVQIAKKLLECALAGNTALLIFLAKTRMGWRERERATMPVELQGGRNWAQDFRDALKSVG